VNTTVKLNTSKTASKQRYTMTPEDQQLADYLNWYMMEKARLDAMKPDRSLAYECQVLRVEIFAHAIEKMAGK